MNLREDVLNAIPDTAREGVLKMALDHNITDPNDPTWGMVSLAWSATQAASISRQTLDAALHTSSKIPEAIYSSTVAASADLKAAVAQAIEQKTLEAGQALVQAIGVAASRGAADLQKAAAGLDKLGADKCAAFVEKWKAAVATAVEKQARTALRRSIARSWVAASFALLLAASAGGAVALGGAALEHRLITVSDLRFYNPDPRRDAVLHYDGPGQITEARTCPRRDQACLNVP